MMLRHDNSLRGAILATFRSASDEDVRRRFMPYVARDWRAVAMWLHASGLALYFLDRLRLRGLCQVLPGEILRGLDQNQADNRERTESLVQEFVRLNTEFGRAQLDYLNVKGLSLGREYCKDPALRSQFDLDFWLRADQAAECKRVLRGLGYRVHETPGTLECHSGSNTHASFQDFYKPPKRRCVEVHLLVMDRFERLAKSTAIVKGQAYPTLSREQAFLHATQHLTKHLRSEWTRASWMLELQNAIRAAQFNEVFWRTVRSLDDAPEAAASVGIAVCSAATVFKASVPEELESWAVRPLDGGIKRWIAEYAPAVATADFPGSKLYLLLERHLTADTRAYQCRRRSTLLPLRTPGPVLAQRGNATVSSYMFRIRYSASRLSFHIREGLRLLLAERQWQHREMRLGTCRAGEGSNVA